MSATSSSRMIRTRFAPSPTGHLHVGGARTALFCWAYARGRGGRFILRIEDTDQKRSSDAAGMAFLEDLAWLGITWDEGPRADGCGGGDAGPYRQSERLAIYDEVVERLVAEKKAYRAFETPEELAHAREAARREGRDARYDRAALALDRETVERYLEEGRPHVVRFKAPDGGVSMIDEVRGEVGIEAGELEDFVIRKADGFPTYHLAVVVDDELMEVTHVIRGEEHLTNTLKHVVLQDALGYRRPVYAHLPLVFNPDGSKMSKRDKDRALRAAVRERGIESPPHGALEPDRWTWWLAKKEHQLELDEAERLAEAIGVTLPEINVNDFRRSGYLPEVLVNYLALLGWNPGEDVEKFDASFLIERFDLDRLQKGAARFDRDKLLAFNLDAIQAMSDAEFATRLREHCRAYHPEFLERLTDDQFDALAAANRSRSKTLGDQIESSRFFIVDDAAIGLDSSKAVRDALEKGEPSGYAHLEAIQPVLRDVTDWTSESIEQAVRSFADARAGGKLGKVAQPLRVAVSGTTVSPAIFDTLAILGRESVLRRVERCLSTRTLSQ